MLSRLFGRTQPDRAAEDTQPLLNNESDAGSDEPASPTAFAVPDVSWIDALPLGISPLAHRPLAKQSTTTPAPPSKPLRWWTRWATSTRPGAAPHEAPAGHADAASRLSTGAAPALVDIESPPVLEHARSWADNSVGTSSLQLEVLHAAPMTRPREFLEVACGGLVGLIFGLQFSGHTDQAWRYYVCPPFFAAITAITTVVLFEPSAILLTSASRHLAAPRPLRTASKLRCKELVGASLGIALGAACGLQYAWEHGGGWRYYIFPQCLAIDVMLPALLFTRWLSSD